MRSHRITVTVDGNTIRVEPDTLTMSRSDQVQWAGTSARKFSVEFEGPGPFGNRVLAHGQATTAQSPRTGGRFKYSVVSEDDPGVRIDPVIIVEVPPTDQAP
jgi:hypothetical protein